MRIGALSVVLLIAGLITWASSYGSFNDVVFHGCYDVDNWGQFGDSNLQKVTIIGDNLQEPD